MKNIYAVMILHKAGKDINEISVKKVLEAANAKVDKIKIKTLIKLLKKINIEKVIKTIAIIKQPIIEQKIKEKKEIIIQKTSIEEETSNATEGLNRLFDF